MGEAKRLKTCLSFLLLVFIVYVAVFAEEEVVKIKKDI